jgi:hypothetical protein
MGKIVDITGMRFGRWAVLARWLERDKGTFWLCRCRCGTERIVDGNNLRRDLSKSCGCFKQEQAKKCKTKHGMCRTSVYERWKAMLQRCLNPQNKNYPDYGGRGIAVIEYYRSFENYYADVGDQPSPGLSIDRINNDGNYEPGNLRWATCSEQVRNRRPRKRKQRAHVADIDAYAVALARAKKIKP